MLSSQGKKLAQALGMLALPESNFICGKVGDFPISIYETPQYQLLLEVAAAPGETAPSRELEDALRMELPELSGQFTVNQMEHGFRIATARCGYGKKLKLVGGLLAAPDLKPVSEAYQLQYQSAIDLHKLNESCNECQIQQNALLARAKAQKEAGKSGASEQAKALKLDAKIQEYQKKILEKEKELAERHAKVDALREQHKNDPGFAEYEQYRDNGIDLAKLEYKEMRQLRRDLQLIFQDPYSSIDPNKTIGWLIEEPLKIHGIGKTKQERDEKVSQVLKAVGLDESYRTRWPNELSGGQRQRVAIAIALILDPDFVVCDEPVSALDVSVQAQVLNLLLDLRQQFGLTYLFISHDLNVVSYVSDRIGVMYLGNLVELGDGEAISQMPLHPYTEALFSASMEVEGDRDRIILSGDLPSPAHPPAGCPFHTRCFACEERCKTEKPQLREFEGGRFCACHVVEKRTGKKPVAHNEALEGNV